MKRVLQLEELLLFGGGILLFAQLPFTWWGFPLLILAPDIGMIGYLAGPVTGAWTYNLFHHRGFAFAIWVAGILLALPLLQLVGIILFSHVAMDRIFGYGLKHTRGFQYTHLGEIGKNAKRHA